MTGVDPKTQVLLDLMAALKRPPLSNTTPAEFREMRARSRDLLNPPAPPVALVRDEIVTGAAGPIAARIYDITDGASRPTLVYFHGGGFVFGDLDSHDALCRRLAFYGNIRVLAVNYRLAPEHPFPAAVDDAIAAFADIAARAKELGVDIARMAIGGDSAGANLSTVTARHMAQSDGPAPKFQLLFYPVTQSLHSTQSREELAEGFFLTKETMDWFDNHYLPQDADRSDPRISPLLTPPPDGLAPALIITAGFDPLKDEGRDYARQLSEAGIECRHVEYADQIHGFVSFTAFSTIAEEAIADAARTVAASLR